MFQLEALTEWDIFMPGLSCNAASDFVKISFALAKTACPHFHPATFMLNLGS
jgi:hypothetical protein